MDQFHTIYYRDQLVYYLGDLVDNKPNGSGLIIRPNNPKQKIWILGSFKDGNPHGSNVKIFLWKKNRLKNIIKTVNCFIRGIFTKELLKAGGFSIQLSRSILLIPAEPINTWIFMESLTW